MNDKNLTFLRSSRVSFDGQSIKVNIYQEKGTGLLYIFNKEFKRISLGGRMGEEAA